MRKSLLFIACVCLGMLPAGRAQTVINGGRSVVGSWDVSSASSTRPAKTGTTLPAACAVGEQFFKSDETAGQNLYFCTAANTWTKMSGAGGGGGTPGGTTDGALQYKSGTSFAGSDKLLWADAESKASLGSGAAGSSVDLSNPNWRAAQNFGVALIRSTTPGKVTALDIMPSSSNPDDAAVGFKHAWIDICNQDLITDGWSNYSCLSQRTSPDWMMIGPSQAGTHAADQIEMQVKSTKGVSLWGGNDGAGNNYKLFEAKRDGTGIGGHEYAMVFSPYMSNLYTWGMATYWADAWKAFNTLEGGVVMSWTPAGTGADQFWTGDVGLKRLGVNSLGVTKGYTSTQYADFTARSLRLNPNTTDTKPACDATQRGKIWVTYGGVGIADIAEICRKGADDLYAWVALY